MSFCPMWSCPFTFMQKHLILYSNVCWEKWLFAGRKSNKKAIIPKFTSFQWNFSFTKKYFQSWISAALSFEHKHHNTKFNLANTWLSQFTIQVTSLLEWHPNLWHIKWIRIKKFTANEDVTSLFIRFLIAIHCFSSTTLIKFSWIQVIFFFFTESLAMHLINYRTWWRKLKFDSK